MPFMILLKPHVWEKSGSRVKCKNALDQSDCNLKNYWKYKVEFLHAGTYLLKLHAAPCLLKLYIDHVRLGGCGQACQRGF